MLKNFKYLFCSARSCSIDKKLFIGGNRLLPSLITLISFWIILLVSPAAIARSIVIPMFFTADTAGVGPSSGSITITETKYGLLFTPYLHGLRPGIHGFHIHENPDCSKAGVAAGGHLDPTGSGKHLGPYNENGHLGDLPVLYAVESAGPVAELTPIVQIQNGTIMNQPATQINSITQIQAGKVVSVTPIPTPGSEELKGVATMPVLAPRLTSIDDLKGHSIIVDEGGDNYSDLPYPNGGTGLRKECGIIP
jgi:superoxide dismutase, Cu-Zn family